MSKIVSYKDLDVWRKSMDLVVLVYGITENFPISEKYCLTSQIRRCCVSIPSNIAEGSRRMSKRDYRRFVLISLGSTAELETQIDLAERLNYVNKENVIHVYKLITDISKMLTKLSMSLRI